MSTDKDQVMYLIFREDLPMSPGKVAAQAGHAVQLMIEALQAYFEHGDDAYLVDARQTQYAEWHGTGITKVALRVKDQAAIDLLRVQLAENDIWTRTVVDEGRTEVPAGSVTCMSIEPMPKGTMRQYVGELKLL
jgi:PTH2 family peptidyl-tRNA hydrolase